MFDVEHADVRSANADDRTAARGEGPGVETPLPLLIPPPGGGDVAAHGGLVQLEAELAVRWSGRPHGNGGHAAGRPGGCRGGTLNAVTRTSAAGGEERGCPWRRQPGGRH